MFGVHLLTEPRTYIIENGCPSLHGNALEDGENSKQDVVELSDAIIGPDPGVIAVVSLRTLPHSACERQLGRVNSLIFYAKRKLLCQSSISVFCWQTDTAADPPCEYYWLVKYYIMFDHSDSLTPYAEFTHLQLDLHLWHMTFKYICQKKVEQKYCQYSKDVNRTSIKHS